MRISKLFLVPAILMFLLPLGSHADWQVTSAGSRFYEDVMNDGVNIFAASSNSGVYKSTNMGSTWTAFNTGLSGDGLRCYKIIFSQNKLIMATVDGVYISDNNAANWVKKSTGLPIGPGANNVFAFTVYNDGGVYFAGTWDGIFRSTDSCETWLPTSMNGGFSATVCFARFNNILFAGRDNVSSGYVFKSTNYGLNWTQLTIAQGAFSAFCLLPDNDRLLVGVTGGVFSTTNNGANWTGLNGGLGSDPYIFSMLKSNGIYFASMGVGGLPVYKSTNNGANWISASEGLGFTGEVHQIMIFNGKMFATSSNGIYKRDMGELTGINNIGSIIPTRNALYQNYPNPFNPSTKIKFDLSSVSNSNSVQLKIYDMLGNEIQSLVNEDLKPGSYEVSWDSFNYASGTYFYKLTAGDFTQTKKLLLIK